MRATGTCFVLMAFDIGFEIDLGAVGSRLAASRPETFKHKRAATDELEIARQPMRFTRTIAPLALEGGLATSDRVEVAIYGFGAVCFTYTVALDLALEALVRTSSLLYDNAALTGDARTRAREVLEALGDAVREPYLAEALEDYVVYHLQPAALPVETLDGHAELLARALRAEEGALSRLEIENALDGRISYGPDELVLVDWFAALLIGAEMDDERRVLELATVELLELRFLDDRLEKRIDEAYGLLARSRRPLLGLSVFGRELGRLARFQADSTILHEGFDNALKLLGDDYLARLYDVCSDRFHFPAWDTAIERKLGTLESVYTKLSDLAARRRAELLEWIIILLIAVDILLYFTPIRGKT
jgi:hypothetical protein